MSGIDRINRYLDMRKAQPMPQLGDLVHCVNTGTDWEGELRLSDLNVMAGSYASSQAEIEMLREALEAVRKEARKGKPDPDKIYGFANAALEPKP